MFTWRTCYVVETKYAHAVEEKSGTVNNEFENVCFLSFRKPGGMIRHFFALGRENAVAWVAFTFFTLWLGPSKARSQAAENTIGCSTSFKKKVKNWSSSEVQNFDFSFQQCECTCLWTLSLFLLLYRSFTVLCARDYNTIFYSLNFQILYFLLSGRVARSGEPTQTTQNIFHIISYSQRIDWNHNHRLATATARGFEKRIESNEERTSTLYLIFIIGPVSLMSHSGNGEMVF